MNGCQLLHKTTIGGYVCEQAETVNDGLEKLDLYGRVGTLTVPFLCNSPIIHRFSYCFKIRHLHFLIFP